MSDEVRYLQGIVGQADISIYSSVVEAENRIVKTVLIVFVITLKSTKLNHNSAKFKVNVTIGSVHSRAPYEQRARDNNYAPLMTVHDLCSIMKQAIDLDYGAGYNVYLKI